jgi:phosphoglycerate dehydrogenase-like enzyme
VIGVKRRPETICERNRANADIVIGLDQLEEYLPQADFVVGVLPGVEANLDFFNQDRVFSKMRKDAVFMNIGRGATVNEDELIATLK